MAAGKSRASKPNAVTPERLMHFAWGYAPTLAIEAAVRHGIFDYLDKAPRTAEQVASARNLSVRGTRAILDLLVALNLLKRTGSRLALSPDSATFLVSTKAAYYGTFFRHISDQLMPSWLQLT